MIQNVLRNLGGIENFGMLSLFLFFFVFTGMLVWVLSMKKTKLDENARIPLDNDNLNYNNTEGSDD